MFSADSKFPVSVIITNSECALVFSMFLLNMQGLIFTSYPEEVVELNSHPEEFSVSTIYPEGVSVSVQYLF